MVAEEKMQEEIDKATEALMKTQLIEAYSRLLQIKHSGDMLKEIDWELSVMETKMDYLGIGYKALQEAFAGADGKGATNE